MYKTAVYVDLNGGGPITQEVLIRDYYILKKAGYTDGKTLDEYLQDIYNDTKRGQNELEIISE